MRGFDDLDMKGRHAAPGTSLVLGFLSLAPMVRQERQTRFRFVADVLPRRSSVWTS